MQIEADVFSGLPNPRWSLSAEESAELSRRMRELPAAASPGALFDGLGYRGMVVTGLEGECTELRVQRGEVRARCGSETRAFTDPGRALERWLVGTGQGRAEPGTLEMLRKETGA